MGQEVNSMGGVNFKEFPEEVVSVLSGTVKVKERSFVNWEEQQRKADGRKRRLFSGF